MTYSDKVKQSKKVLEAIKALGDDESIVVTYGKDREGKPKEYKVRCSIYKHTGKSYSIHLNTWWSTDGMNIDSLTNTQAKAYTYDMMSQRTSYNFPLYEMELVPEVEEVEELV